MTKVKDFFHTNEEFYRFDQKKQAIHKSDVSISTISKEPSSSLSSAPSLSPSSSSSFSTDLPSSPTSASEKVHTGVSEEVKRAMLGDELYNRIYHPKAKSMNSEPVTEDLKQKMLGEEFYNRAHSKKVKTGESHAISEDLKKSMVGEEFYNRAHGVKQDPKLASEKGQTQDQKLSQTHADTALKDSPSEEQKTTLSYKPPSPGRRR